jgi:vacuolar-type H+-ATPase subunit E/Vma4
MQEALEEVKASLDSSGPIHLEVDPRDQVLMAGFILNLDLALTVSYDLECWGGLVAKSEDGRVVLINTLESRLERAAPYLRHVLAALFEAELDECQAGYRIF